MADVNRMMEALRNADAVGDTAAATRIASMIREAQSAQTMGATEPAAIPSNTAPPPEIQKPELVPPQEPYSGTILPFTRSAEGDVSFDPNVGVVGAIKRAFMAPGEALKGELDPWSKEGMARAMEAATVMTPMGAAGRVPGSVFSKGLFTRKPRASYKDVKPNQPLVKDLKSQAGKIYKEVETSGITIKPEAFSGMVQGLETRLKKAGFHPKMHPNSAGAVEAIGDFVGNTLTMQDMGIVRRLAKSAKNSIVPEDARIGREILNHIDENMRQIPGVSEKFAKADKLWSMAKKTELLDKAVAAAKETASGFENGLRIEFRKLLKKARDGKLQLSPQETAAMEKVVKGSVPANVLKGLGKLGPAPGSAGNALLASLAATGGYALGGPVAAGAVIGSGYASRLGAQALTKGAAQRARGIVSGAVPEQVYAPSITQETMLKALLGQGLNERQPNSSMQDALGAR
jgi:hypothetical protein